MSSNSRDRICGVCKAEGKRVPAGLGKGGDRNRRAKINGVTTSVCDFHADAVIVVRADVSGKGTEARKAAEATVSDRNVATDAAERKITLDGFIGQAYGMLTIAHLEQITRMAWRHAGGNDMRRTDLYDTMVDMAATRIGQTLHKGETPNVDRIVSTMHPSFADVSAIKAGAGQVRLDAGSNGMVATDTIPTESNDERVWIVGGMAVNVADIVTLLQGDKPAGLAWADWDTLQANYS